MYHYFFFVFCYFFFLFFFQAEDGIRDFCLSRGLGDVYKRQLHPSASKLITLGGHNQTTVTDCGKLLERIYRGECVSKEASEEMLDLLKNQQNTSKIPEGLGVDVPTANKTGETDEDQHDCLLYTSPSPRDRQKSRMPSSA